MDRGKSTQLVRLNKFIADSGVASRRKADSMIAKGEVTVNGKRVYELGGKVDPARDHVVVDGKTLRPQAHKIYLMFHKPKNVITTMEDPEGRPCVGDFFRRIPERVFPVGRLDWDSEGLVLITNDGDWAQKISHPKHEVTKTYLVKVSGRPTEEKLAKLRRGVPIIGGRVAAKEVDRIKHGEGSKFDWIRIVITEGKNHQVRQMMAKIDCDVLKLQRVAIGRLEIGKLDRGDFRPLTERQVEKIFEPDLRIPEHERPARKQSLKRQNIDTNKPFTGRTPKKRPPNRRAKSPNRAESR